MNVMKMKITSILRVATALLACSASTRADDTPPVLTTSSDGLVFSGGTDTRVHFTGSPQAGYDVVFERKELNAWQHAAAFPAGQVWSVYSDWRDSWFAQPRHIKVQKVEPLTRNQVRATATADIDGQPWSFSDVYSVEHGMVRIDRSFAHTGPGSQSKITLESRLRLPLGTDQRLLMPQVLYNNNPSSTLIGTQISMEPGGLGLYEEHRLPIPMVNIESSVNGTRLYGSLVALPSKIAQGNKGSDHWWSLGLEYGKGYVDLLSVSGPVATNGKKSQLYGRRNRFDPYDDAYLNVQGPVEFKKTLYVDLGSGIKTGYAFRETLWKAYDVFQPTKTPHMSFPEAMSLVAEYAKKEQFRRLVPKAGENTGKAIPAGYKFKYAWVGGCLGTAYGMLAHADRTGDQEARTQALDSVRFFVENSGTGVEGLYYGDYDVRIKDWRSTSFYKGSKGISSRQYGENLEHLASLVELGRRLKLPEAEQWLACLKKAGGFLLRSPRHKGLFPRAWTPEGGGMDWPAQGEPPAGTISAAGVQCVLVFSRLATLTGEAKWGKAAAETMDAYWREFGETLATPPWGATIDAGGEDKEAGWGMMRAATDVYVATREPRFLQMAKDAADWTLTWMYFHDVGMKPESGLLFEHLHTVGWTAISTQNQEIDVWGYFMAPDFYLLGQVAKDERYRKIGRVLYQACTQTLSRPGVMFGPKIGSQSEHYNHTNCTYKPGGPETWRGSQHAMGIAWTTAGAVYGGMRLSELAPEPEWFALPRH